MSNKGGKHVMISYQWDVQDRMLKLKDKLQRAGYKIWMDVEKMEGSILQSMGEAVENAAVILMCISEKYQNSISCRTEAEYAFKMKVPIVPLMGEKHEATGWLGVLLGSRLYYRMDNDDQLNQNFPALIRSLGDKGRLQTTNSDNIITGSVRDMARHYNGKSPTHQPNQRNIYNKPEKNRTNGRVITREEIQTKHSAQTECLEPPRRRNDNINEQKYTTVFTGFNQYETPDKYEYRYVLPEIPDDRQTITFRVRAEHDAHIALSSANKDVQHMYEIVLGGEHNNISAIRLGRECKNEVKVSTPELLSADEFRHFYISFGDQDIRVGQVGHDPFIRFTHKDPFDINFIGFSTGFGSTGVWEFCTFGYNQHKTNDEYSYRYVLPELPEYKRTLTFRVMSSGDAHIALSTQNTGDSDDTYEIVLGAGGNSFSTIRLGKLGDTMVSEDTQDLLSATEFRHFYVCFEDGHIRVGEVGKTAFMEYVHDKPYDVNYVGFSTGFGNTGVWEFDDFGCNNYETPDEYNYRFVLPEVPAQKQTITFRVMAGSDAHLALCSENDDAHDMYEIVLGAGGNTYSGIRLSKLGHTEVTEDTVDLLSVNEYREFAISFDDQEGTLEIRKVGEEKPFLSFTHSDPYRIRFIGFSTGFGNTGMWEFPDFGN